MDTYSFVLKSGTIISLKADKMFKRTETYELVIAKTIIAEFFITEVAGYYITIDPATLPRNYKK